MAKLAVVAPGAVVLSSTETVLPVSFATIKSGKPSPLSVGHRHRHGAMPVAKVCWVAKVGVVAPGAVVLSSTETCCYDIRDDQVGFAVAVDVRRRHRLAYAAGGEGLLGGEARGARARSSGVEQHRTVLSPEFVTIRSGLPSPLRSAAVTETRPVATVKVCWVAKLAVVAPGRWC